LKESSIKKNAFSYKSDFLTVILRKGEFYYIDYEKVISNTPQNQFVFRLLAHFHNQIGHLFTKVWHKSPPDKMRVVYLFILHPKSNQSNFHRS